MVRGAWITALGDWIMPVRIQLQTGGGNRTFTVPVETALDGNDKLGTKKHGVETHSRTPGPIERGGTCPGATLWCVKCYALAAELRYPPAAASWAARTVAPLPAISDKTRFFRWHVAGDFDSVAYIQTCIDQAREHPHVKFWTYTRSWAVPVLLPALERLRAEPNVQLFASIDPTTKGRPPEKWRRAWIKDDDRMRRDVAAMEIVPPEDYKPQGLDCPEQTGKVKNCAACGWCFTNGKNGNQRGDVVFATHGTESKRSNSG